MSAQTGMQILDAIAGYLAPLTASGGTLDGVQLIIGDPFASMPDNLPALFLNPESLEEVESRMTAGAHGFDMYRWSFEMILVVELAENAPPIEAGSVGAITYYIQPGWQTMVSQADAILSAMRENIVLSGATATSRVLRGDWIPLPLHGKLYRGARLIYQTQIRRTR
jgi:hypothetical protein